MDSHASAGAARAYECDDTFPSILRKIDRLEFSAVLSRAENDAAEAIRIRDDMRRWADRLAPFFESEPSITVAEALSRYRDATAKEPGLR